MPLGVLHSSSNLELQLHRTTLISCNVLILLVFAFEIKGTAQIPASQRNDVIKRNVAKSTVETVIYLKLVLYSGSDRCCYVFFANQKYPHSTPSDFTGAPQGTSVHSMGTMAMKPAS